MNRGVSAGDCPKSQRERGLPVRRVFSILEVGGQDACAPSGKRVFPHFLDSLGSRAGRRSIGDTMNSHDTGVAKRGTFAFFEGRLIPLEEARVSVLTHCFLYGTGVFEGI